MYSPVVVGFMWKYPSLRHMANPAVRVCELFKKNTPSDELKYMGRCESVICKYSIILCKWYPYIPILASARNLKTDSHGYQKINFIIHSCLAWNAAVEILVFMLGFSTERRHFSNKTVYRGQFFTIISARRKIVGCQLTDLSWNSLFLFSVLPKRFSVHQFSCFKVFHTFFILELKIFSFF